MRNFILFFAATIVLYSCIEISGKEPQKSSANKEASNTPPDGRLRVGKAEGQNMRGRRGQDNAVVKISARDLMAVMNTSSPASNDSLIFYFVKYDSPQDKDRYLLKVPTANWNSIKGKSSVLVGFVGNTGNNAERMIQRMGIPSVPVYDLGVVCPPPPDCACEMQQ